MDIFDSFATDATKETEGVWVDISVDASIKVARAGTRSYSRDLQKQLERYELALASKDDLADDTSDMILVNLVAEHVLLDWKGIKFKGEALPYSKDNAKTVLKLKDFRRLVMKHSEDITNFKNAKEEAVAKNS